MPSINVIKKIEICWIMHQSPHNLKSPDRFLKWKTWTKKFDIPKFSERKKYSYETLWRWCIPSINPFWKLEASWIIYQSSHNVKKHQSQHNFQSRKIKWNSRIFRKTVLGNISEMTYTKYQCNRKTRSMLNHVPKLAHVRWSLNFCKSSKFSKSKKFEIPKFLTKQYKR